MLSALSEAAVVLMVSVAQKLVVSLAACHLAILAWSVELLVLLASTFHVSASSVATMVSVELAPTSVLLAACPSSLQSVFVYSAELE